MSPLSPQKVCSMSLGVPFLNKLTLPQYKLTVVLVAFEHLVAAWLIVKTTFLVEIQEYLFLRRSFQVLVSYFVEDWVFQSLCSWLPIAWIELEQAEEQIHQVLIGVNEVLAQRLVLRLALIFTTALLNQILEHVHIVDDILVIYESNIWFLQRSQLLYYLPNLVVETERIDFIIFIFFAIFIGGFLLERWDRVARVAIEKTVLEIFGLLETFVGRRRVDYLTYDAAETPHVDLTVVCWLCQNDFWWPEITCLDLQCQVTLPLLLVNLLVRFIIL